MRHAAAPPRTFENTHNGSNDMKNTFHRAILMALCLAALALAGCDKSQSPQDGAAKSAAAGKTADKHGHEAEKSGGHEDGHGEEEQLKLGAEEIAAAGIKTEELQEQEVSEQLTVTATIRPNQDRIAHVAPRVPGRVVKVPANLGDAVKAGQTLAVLDSLEVGEAHSAWLQARTAQALAKADFERAEALHGEQIIARKDHLRAHAEYEKSKAALAAAGDRLRMLGVSPAPAADGKAVSAFPLTTPFAGTVIEKHAILGELAQPDKPLFTVADLSRLWIEANLFEKDLGRVKAGAEAVVTVAAYPDEAFAGKLTYIAAVVDKETRTVSGAGRGRQRRMGDSSPRCSPPRRFAHRRQGQGIAPAGGGGGADARPADGLHRGARRLRAARGGARREAARPRRGEGRARRGRQGGDGGHLRPQGEDHEIAAWRRPRPLRGTTC
jgi:cobalt-zinc-cadmium efflux system membrane fusion protein